MTQASSSHLCHTSSDVPQAVPRQNRTGHIQATSGQNRAPLIRAGLGQVAQGTAKAQQRVTVQSRAGLGQAKLGRAGHGSL